MAGAAEGRTGHQEQVQLRGFFAEGHVVRLQRPGEHIEAAPRLHAGEAILRQGGEQPVLVPLIHLQLAGQVGAAAHRQLHQGGGAVAADGPGDLRAHLRDGQGLLRLGVHRQIANALPRQGQGLGEGVAGDGVVIEPGGVGLLCPGEQQLPIGLVGDEIDGVAELALLLLQQGGQLRQGLGGQDDARGIVGGVDEQGGDGGIQALLQGPEVDLEGVHVRRDHRQAQPGPLDIGAVLGEIGGKDDDLVPRLGHRPQGVAQGPRRTAGPRVPLSFFLFLYHTVLIPFPIFHSQT